MSFLKIEDPSKCDKLVAEYLKTKKKIQDDFRSERLGEQSLYEDFGKIFKPITEQQQKTSEEIVSKLEAIPAQQALPWGQPETDVLPEPLLPTDIGQIERKYLTDSYGMAGDKTFRLNNRGGEFFLGNASVDFDGDDLIIDGNKYNRTKGLWDLITLKKTVLGLATEEDKKNYEEIMPNCEAMRNRKNPQRPAANKGYKWQNIIRAM